MHYEKHPPFLCPNIKAQGPVAVVTASEDEEEYTAGERSLLEVLDDEKMIVRETIKIVPAVTKDLSLYIRSVIRFSKGPRGPGAILGVACNLLFPRTIEALKAIDRTPSTRKESNVGD